MDDKESVKFRVTSLKAGNYYAWSSEMEVILKEKDF